MARQYYSGRQWTCPFLTGDSRAMLYCEAADVHLPMAAMHDYASRFCAGEWQRCSLARALNEHYDKES